MGIPRLSSHIAQYGVPTLLGCQDPQCSFHQGSPRGMAGVVIDGPSLVHHVYGRLLSERSSEVDVVWDTIAPYSRIGSAVIDFLNLLESVHIPILRLCFDGGLPIQKRDTRINRLNTSFQSLSALHEAYPRGLPISSSSPSTVSSMKIVNGRQLAQNLPIPPFIIPAALDQLAESKYASITEVVPGEADPYCARLARELGAIILTNDSDLVVYDIGSEAAVAFFHSLPQNEKSTVDNPQNPCRALYAHIWQHHDISNRLGLDLQKLAYEVKQNPHVPYKQVIQNAKTPIMNLAVFEDFLTEYDLQAIPSPESLVLPKTRLRNGYIDPRLNELIIQIANPSVTGDLNVYLPVLLSDPSRVSAWQASQFIRKILYTLLIANLWPTTAPPQAVCEHDPKRASHPCIVDLSTNFHEDAQDLLRSLSTHTTVKNFALYTSISSLERPPTVSEMYSKTTIYTWQHIHLVAQMHGILYSLRLLKQCLELILPADPVKETIGNYSSAGPRGILPSSSSSTVEVIPSLYYFLQNLPTMRDLLPRSSILISKEEFQDAVTMLHEQRGKESHHHHEQDDQDGSGDIHRKTHHTARDFTPVVVGRSKKKTKKKRTPRTHPSKVDDAGEKKRDLAATRPTIQQGYYAVLATEN